MSAKSANLQANAICPQNQLFFIGMGICYFSNRPLGTFGHIVATLYCPVRSSYPQLHGIVNLIQILQGGLEIVLLSWRTFLLTDLHSAVHLCFMGHTDLRILEFNHNNSHSNDRSGSSCKE